ncbi:putative phosphothreonine lyase domain-containg protein [Kitasatospora sp. NPDC059327]|uniref:putative phosphothreonine lyase domain-containing protein n=1 Tax=Kitasatospora sp. NPDC059327 TaxID=3346803 RepID=UPI0036CBEE7D
MHTHSTRTADHPRLSRPSAVTDRPWLWASAPGFCFPLREAPATPHGKWLWFLPVRALDAGWRLVQEAVEDGKLGPGAKAATLGNPFGGDPTRRPVIVYTADCTDEDDVTRVLATLRALGVNDALPYKTDEATALGEYGDRTSLYTSPAGTTKVVRRTPRYTAPA